MGKYKKMWKHLHREIALRYMDLVTKGIPNEWGIRPSDMDKIEAQYRQVVPKEEPQEGSHPHTYILVGYLDVHTMKAKPALYRLGEGEVVEVLWYTSLYGVMGRRHGVSWASLFSDISLFEEAVSSWGYSYDRQQFKLDAASLIGQHNGGMDDNNYDTSFFRKEEGV